MIHDEWMQSPGHRTNLLNPDVDHVGVAVVESRGVLYAVADYERAVNRSRDRRWKRGWLRKSGQEGYRF